MSLQSQLSRLDRLPPQALQTREGISIDAARRWAAQQPQQKFAVADLAGARDKTEVLRIIAQALEFPDWFGANLDALYDCLTDLPDRETTAAGWLVCIDGLTAAAISDADRTALLDVFRDAAAAFARSGRPFRVLYA